MSFMQQIVWKIFSKKCIQTNGYYTSQSAACEGWHYLDYSSTNWIDSQTLLENILSIHTKEVFSEKSCFKNFAHPLSEGEILKNKI